MKKKLVLFLFLTISLQSISQSIITKRETRDHTKNQTYRTFTIEQLKKRVNDGKYEKALNDQLGVIGNDYFGEQEIGMAIEQERRLNTRYPIDGFKRTIKGKVVGNYFRIYNNSDRDDDYHVEIEAALNDPLLIKNKVRLNAETNAKTPHNLILGEIDIHQSHKQNFLTYRDDMPAKFIDYACLYGPWIADRGNYGVQSSHGTYFEIHPSEQIWWTEKRKTEIVYSLLSANDNSGHFDDAGSDYDEENGARPLKNGAWVPKILNSVFAIPFCVQLNKGTKQFNLLQLSNRNTHPSVDGKIQYLKYRGKTIVSVINFSPTNDLIDIEFDNVGFETINIQAKNGKTASTTDTLIKGFLLIKNKVGQAIDKSDIAGHLLTLVTETGYLKDKIINESLIKFKIKLENITCKKVDDSDDKEDIYGYIGARVLDISDKPGLANVKPINSNTPLLWAKNDGDCINLKAGQVLSINKEFVYETSSSAILTLIADLNEDDANDDNNPTMTDGISGWTSEPIENLVSLADDIFGTNSSDSYKDDLMGKVKEENVIISRFTKGQKEKRKFQFSSGGTLLEVNLLIERL